jgi:hypothetical protein
MLGTYFWAGPYFLYLKFAPSENLFKNDLFTKREDKTGPHSRDLHLQSIPATAHKNL